MREKPSERIGELARVRLNKERDKGMFLFPEGIHCEVVLEAILDYLDENHMKTITIYYTSGKTEEWSKVELFQYIKDRVAEQHLDDLVDFVFFQIKEGRETVV